MIKVLYFGRLSDIGVGAEFALPQAINTVSELAAYLGKDNAALRTAIACKGNRVAVNTVMTAFDAPIKDGDEIAFMSPLSGG